MKASKTHRSETVLVLFAFLGLIAHVFTPNALAENDILYGLTFDGKLVQIDKSTGEGTQVRSQLPSNKREITAFAYWNGYFVAAYDQFRAGPPYQNQGLIAFGPTEGDEVTLGMINNVELMRTLAQRPNGSLFGAMRIGSGGGSGSSAPNVVTIDPSNHSYSCAPDLECYNSAYDDYTRDLTGIAFYDANTLFLCAKTGGKLTKYAYSNNTWSPIYRKNFFTNPSGLVVEISGGSTIFYSVNTILPYLNNPTVLYTSTLKKYNLTTSTLSTVGEVTGFPSIAGLAFGPEIDDVDSPPKNAIPWEPVRMLLAD